MSYRIILIEDDPLYRKLIQSTLSRAGHRVDVADGGLAGLELLRHARYDIALVDYHLPEMDGYALARLIKGAAGPAPATRLVALTGDPTGLAARRGSDTMFQAIVSKPVDPQALLSLLDQVYSEAPRASLPPTPAARDARRASEAFWLACGLNRRPRLAPALTPDDDQVAALALCFELVGRQQADAVLLLHETDVEAARSMAGEHAPRLPIIGIGVPERHCDVVFAVDEPRSWTAVAKLVSPPQVSGGSVPRPSVGWSLSGTVSFSGKTHSGESEPQAIAAVSVEPASVALDRPPTAGKTLDQATYANLVVVIGQGPTQLLAGQMASLLRTQLSELSDAGGDDQRLVDNFEALRSTADLLGFKALAAACRALAEPAVSLDARPIQLIKFTSAGVTALLELAQIAASGAVHTEPVARDLLRI